MSASSMDMVGTELDDNGVICDCSGILENKMTAYKSDVCEE